MPDGPVAIVTGGGRGIGAACARELASRGYRLVLMSLSGSSEPVARELGGLSFTGSVTSDADLQNFVDLALESYGRIDAVVSSTGHPSFTGMPMKSLYEFDEGDHLLDITDSDWHEMLDTLILPSVRLARLVTPHMRQQGSGAIVNISGLGAAVPVTKYPFGAMLRHALVGFAQIYTAHNSRYGIRMNNVLPGFMENFDWTPELMDTVPAGRPGRLEEVAKTVAFFLSDESAYITGQDLLVDGGAARVLK